MEDTNGIVKGSNRKRSVLIAAVATIVAIVIVVPVAVTTTRNNRSRSGGSESGISSEESLNNNSTSDSSTVAPQSVVSSASPSKAPTVTATSTTSAPSDGPQISTTSPSKTLTDPPAAVPATTTAPVSASTTASDSPTSAPTKPPAVTREPTNSPTKAPTARPIVQTTTTPTKQPTASPTKLPTAIPVEEEDTSAPSKQPTNAPTKAPTRQPTPSPVTPASNEVTYRPGLLTVNQVGLRLSQGLSARIIAQSDERVKYDTGGESSRNFHRLPDGAATFSHNGGWIYVSNSEIRRPDPLNHGGVGALAFNSKGELIDYNMVLKNSTGNCGGGKTPWGTWISAEEWGRGTIWQVDPTGRREPEELTVGLREQGLYEAFAHDLRDNKEPKFFVTEDDRNGPLRRFIPVGEYDDYKDDRWSILHADGAIDYLVLEPGANQDSGTFYWTNDETKARESSFDFYPNAEGLDVHNNELFFISKRVLSLFVLDLDTGRYARYSTRKGTFRGTPDNVHFNEPDGLLYFTEEDDRDAAAIHARDASGRFFAICEGPSSEATAGLAFSPDYMRMYFSWQHNGTLFEVKRDDGRSFVGDALSVQYHSSRV